MKKQDTEPVCSPTEDNGRGFRDFIRRNSHILLALYLPVYLCAFFWVEGVVTDSYWVSHCALDDYIPFIEYFVIPYYLWYPSMGAIGFYLMFTDPPAFRRYMWFIAISFSLSIVIFLIFPNGQDMRPAVFERDNFCTMMVAAIYSSDTNTNVLPSIHVVGSLAVTLAVFDSKKTNKLWLKLSSILLTLLICAATVFIKQHSVLDIIAGIVFTVMVYLVVYVFGRKLFSNPILKCFR